MAVALRSPHLRCRHPPKRRCSAQHARRSADLGGKGRARRVRSLGRVAPESTQPRLGHRAVRVGDAAPSGQRPTATAARGHRAISATPAARLTSGTAQFPFRLLRTSKLQRSRDVDSAPARHQLRASRQPRHPEPGRHRCKTTTDSGRQASRTEVNPGQSLWSAGDEGDAGYSGGPGERMTTSIDPVRSAASVKVPVFVRSGAVRCCGEAVLSVACAALACDNHPAPTGLQRKTGDRNIGRIRGS